MTEQLTDYYLVGFLNGLDLDEVKDIRLLQIEAYLRAGEFGHKKFDFAIFNTSYDDDVPRGKCGAAGCAIGEFPFLFKKDWEFSKATGEPVLRGNNHRHPMVSAAGYLGVSWEIVSHLFAPYHQRTALFGGKELTDQSTPEQVADGIRDFLVRLNEVKQFKEGKEKHDNQGTGHTPA